MELLQFSANDFEIVYDTYADMLYRVALVNVKNPSDAEDVVHDVFIKYFENQQKFKDDKHREAWLVRVTINACRDHLRKKAYRTHTPLEEVHHLHAQEEDEGIIYHLSQLPEKYRSVITLHYLEGYSVNEITKMLGLSASAVKMRLSRGRELLKAIIEKGD